MGELPGAAGARSAAPEPAEDSGALSDARPQHQREGYKKHRNIKVSAGSVVTSRGAGTLLPMAG